MSGPNNGFSQVSRRAKEFGYIAAAITALFLGGTVLQAKLITEPAQRAAADKVSDENEVLYKKLSRQIAAEGQVRDVADSLLFVRMSRIESVVADGVYTRAEVEEIKRQLIARQDSTAATLLRVINNVKRKR